MYDFHWASYNIGEPKYFNEKEKALIYLELLYNVKILWYYKPRL